METALFHNKCVRLSDLGFPPRFGIDDLVTPVRKSPQIGIPITTKLLDYLKYCGIDVKEDYETGSTLASPRFTVGFEIADDQSSFNKAYVRMTEFKFLIDLFGKEDGNSMDNHDVKLRLDIENLTEVQSSYCFKPDIASHLTPLLIDSPFAAIGTTVKFTSTDADDCRDYGDFLFYYWADDSRRWEITASLSLLITKKNSLRDRPDPAVTDLLATTRKMRTEELHCDFTIKTESKAAFKCHRSVLAAHSSYFARMFQAGMVEDLSGTVELSDRTEAGVRAMLDYLYVWETAEPETNPLICVELLKAAHQYDIKTMENCMKQILLSKPVPWYTPEAALQLVIYLKDVDQKELKVKAVEVFKSKREEVQKLPDYEEVLEDPAVVTQLFTYFSSN